jgi:hypothetical protein
MQKAFSNPLMCPFQGEISGLLLSGGTNWAMDSFYELYMKKNSKRMTDIANVSC